MAQAGMRFSPDDWARLGRLVRDAREAKGWSRRHMAEASGVSEKSIQITEEGRVPTRWPGSLASIESALGWRVGTARWVLEGNDPNDRPPPKPLPPALADSVRRVRSGAREQVHAMRENAIREQAQLDLEPILEQPEIPGLLSARRLELTESGRMAQDTFVRQVKRHRNVQGLSPGDLAERISQIGGDLQESDIVHMENGTRVIRSKEALLLAQALGLTVEEVLMSAIRHAGGGADLSAPPDEEELAAQAKAVQQRLFEVAEQVSAAAQAMHHAQLRAEEAREAATMARMYFDQVRADQSSLEREYHYMLGRIDTLRAARGEQVVDVVIEEDESDA